MKRNILILIILFSGLNLHAQLQADAGNEKYICWEQISDQPTIGGNPTASGGIEPYSYNWKSKNIGRDRSTDLNRLYLDDSTAANPELLYTWFDSIMYYVRVTDSIGSVAQDSVLVWGSAFYYHLVYIFWFIDKGDSTEIWSPNIQNARDELLSYTWTPNYNISDTSVARPTVWPEFDIMYQLRIIDPYGCISYPEDCFVHVTPTNIFQLEPMEVMSKVVPNPINYSSVIKFQNKENSPVFLKIYDTKGNLILDLVTQNNSFEIGTTIRESGSYFYTLSSEGKIISSGQFVKD